MDKNDIYYKNLIVMKFYSLTKKKMSEVQEELDKINSKNEAI
ncbi:hypothetical protein [Clostridium culturomicium]|nr:hypothetical protein [Clostridium culturomicium]